MQTNCYICEKEVHVTRFGYLVLCWRQKTFNPDYVCGECVAGLLDMFGCMSESEGEMRSADLFHDMAEEIRTEGRDEAV